MYHALSYLIVRRVFSQTICNRPSIGMDCVRYAHTQRGTTPTLHNNSLSVCFSFVFDVLRCCQSAVSIHVGAIGFFSWMLLGALFSCIKCVFRTTDFVRVFSTLGSELNWFHCAIYWIDFYVNRLSKSVLLVFAKVLNVLVSWNQIFHGKCVWISVFWNEPTPDQLSAILRSRTKSTNAKWLQENNNYIQIIFECK